MRLKTHNAYSEMQFSEDKKSWSVRIYDVNGKVLEQKSGEGENEEASRAAAKAFVANVEPNYKKEV